MSSTSCSLNKYTLMTLEAYTTKESQVAHSLSVDISIPSYPSRFPNLLVTIHPYKY